MEGLDLQALLGQLIVTTCQLNVYSHPETMMERSGPNANVTPAATTTTAATTMVPYVQERQRTRAQRARCISTNSTKLLIESSKNHLKQATHKL